MRKEYYTFPSSRVWIDRDEILEKVNKEKQALESDLMGFPLGATGRVYIKGQIDSLEWVEDQLIKYGKEDDK